MPDQAQDLRQMASLHAEPKQPRRGERPVMLAVAGGAAGAGTTMVALNIAASLAKHGSRTMVVDADPRGGSLATLCGTEERYTIADLLTGRSGCDKVLQRGPRGIRLLPGERDWPQDHASPAEATERLLDVLDEQTSNTDAVVIDAGDVANPIAYGLARHANALLVVTGADAAATFHTFTGINGLATLCRLHETKVSFPLYLLVNGASTGAAARLVFTRLAQTCRRMLGVTLRFAGYLESNRSTKAIFSQRAIGLNLPTRSVDTVRRVLAAELLLKWRKTIACNACLSGDRRLI